MRYPYTLELKPEAARKMTRAEYKEARHYCRYLRRLMEPAWKKMEPQINKAVTDMLFYGYAKVDYSGLNPTGE